MKTTKDLYVLLGLPSRASQDDIRRVHRRLVYRHHPDANPGDCSAEECFKEIQQAYEVLSNLEKRREYDKGLHTSSREHARGRPHVGRTGGRTRRKALSTADLSDLLGRLKDLFRNAQTDGFSATEANVPGGNRLERVASHEKSGKEPEHAERKKKSDCVITSETVIILRCLWGATGSGSKPRPSSSESVVVRFNPYLQTRLLNLLMRFCTTPRSVFVRLSLREG